MQKVLQRTELAKGQAKRKARIVAAKEETAKRLQRRQAAKPFAHEVASAVHRERVRRRQDWELGPLSPWRSNWKAMQADGFGSWSEAASQAKIVEWPAKMKHQMFKPGDRVVIVKGHETVVGLIGRIKSIERDPDQIVLDGVNEVDMLPTPDAAWGFMVSRNSPTKVPHHLSFDQIRLVYPLPNPVTGVPEDCVLTNLVARNHRFDVYENEHVFERWLEPQHICIPWPDKEETVYEDQPPDTLRIQSEEQSFLPTLLSPPMPHGIIDELRNQYGKFRDRHEDEYIARKMAEDDAAAAETQRGRALLPRGARNTARLGKATAPMRSANEKRRVELSDELAAAIGAHMEAALSLSPAQDGAAATPPPPSSST